MKYQAVIFDVGDTLLELYPSESQIYIDRMKELGFEINEQLAKAITNAISTASQKQIQKEQNGAPRMSDEDFTIMIDKAALSCVNTKINEFDLLVKLRDVPVPEQELRIIPGTIEALQSVKGMGFRLGIVSNHREWLPDYLTKIGLSAYFETIVVSDIVGVEKPDIRIMQIAINSLELNASDCLYVGDHPFDVLCAKNAGMDCAWLATPDSILPDSVPYKEDYRIEKLRELINVL